MKSKLHVVLADIHYPEHDARAIKSVFEFMRAHRKQIASVTLLGDALDCQSLSRHTKGKPRLRKQRGYRTDIDGFKRDILDPIEKIVSPTEANLVYICGNHEDWIESELLDEMPELDGIVNIPVVLNLDARGWNWYAIGEHVQIGRVILMHGDQIGSSVHVAKKMVESVNETCVMGHVHRVSSYSKASLVTERRKWCGYTLGCLCTVAPSYAKNAPNAFVTGFGVLEEWGSFVNVHSIIIMPNGEFSYGGEVYGQK
jgi:predicted phosphodiesterase